MKAMTGLPAKKREIAGKYLKTAVAIPLKHHNHGTRIWLCCSCTMIRPTFCLEEQTRNQKLWDDMITAATINDAQHDSKDKQRSKMCTPRKNEQAQ
jgi:hypothetical protein